MPPPPSNDAGTAGAELRIVDEEYTSGLMNAFGRQSQQDRVLGEMEAVKQLQCRMLERANAVVQLTSAPFAAPDDSSPTADTQIHRVVHSVVQRLGVGEGKPPANNPPPQVSALHDAAFEDMATHFAALDESMVHIADHLQGMQWHLDSLRQNLSGA